MQVDPNSDIRPPPLPSNHPRRTEPTAQQSNMSQHHHNDATNSDPEEDDIHNYYPDSRPASAPNGAEQNPRRRQRADSEEEHPNGDVGRSFTTLMHSLLAPAFSAPRPQGAQQNNTSGQQNARPAPNPNRPTLPFGFFGPGIELGGGGHNHRPGTIVTTRIVLSNGQGPPVTHVYGNVPGGEPAPDLATYVRPVRAHPNVLINNSASALPRFGTASYPSEVMDEAPAIPPSVGNPNAGGALIAVPRSGRPAAIPGAPVGTALGALQRPRLARYNTRVLVIVVRGPADDARRLFTELMTNMGGPAGAPGQEGQQQRPRSGEAGDNPFAGASPFQALLAALLNPGQAEHGDAVYTQEALDRVITRLMEEHQSSGAAPPAPSEAIDKLPLKKLDAKMLGEEGKATCPVCMEDVVLDEEVVELPCKHWFHEECGKTWLNNHNTCPICRKPITGDAPHDHGDNNNQNNNQNQGWDSIPRGQSSSNAPQNGPPPPYAPPAFTFFNSGPRRTSNESRPERRDRLDSIRRAGGVTYEADDPPLNIPGSFRYEPPSERAVRPADATEGERSFADPNSAAFRDFLNAPAARLPDHEDRHAEQRADLRLRRENSFPLSRERAVGGRSILQHNPYVDDYGIDAPSPQPYRPSDNNRERARTTPLDQGRNSNDRGSMGSNASNNGGGGGITGVLGGIWRRFSGQNNGNGQGR